MGNINGGRPTVAACTFTGNTALNSGGGMHNNGSSPLVTNCGFSGNSATLGGGMFNDNSIATVTNCMFSGNSAGNGGGMSNNFSIPTVTNCTFAGNTALFGGGGMWGFQSNPAVTNCTFCRNAPDDIVGSYTDGGGNIFECASGACCLDDSCIIAVEALCIAVGGTYQGDATICEASTCPTPCPADLNGDGAVDTIDFLNLLSQWGPCP
jgi:hypothetical protein